MSRVNRNEPVQLSEKQLDGIEKAKKIIEWLEGKELKEPIVIARYMTIDSPAVFIDSHKQALAALTPLSDQWRTHYMRIYELKKHIEHEQELHR